MTLSEELKARNLIDNSTFADLSELDDQVNSGLFILVLMPVPQVKLLPI